MEYPQQSGSSRDPLQLERLAEELAERELAHKPTGPQNHDLPVFIPLSHSNPYLAASTFNVEDFLLSRAYTSLPDLRAELRDYLSTLKEELVKLINDDYEAFISLSTDLRGEGVRLERLKWPLGGIRAEVLESRGELQRIQDAIKAKLEKRSSLRDEKTFLHLLLKISESVTRLESLLLIASPSDGEQVQDNVHSLKIASREEDAADNRSRGNRAEHLARVASEYTQLLYHVSKARTDKCAFVDECQWRIDRIKSTLSSDLDHLFSVTLIALVSGKEAGKDVRATEADKARWLGDVTECLRTYDILGLWGDAEEVIRTDVVREFVKNAIYPGAMAAPHSPIAPTTPFGPGPNASLSTVAGHPPRTPYTPFSAFASKQNPFDASFSAQTQAHLLDDTDNPLASLYNTILRFVERDMRRIMEIADKVSVKGGSKGLASVSRTQLLAAASVDNLPASISNEGGDGGFHIMANVVWAEIGKAIMDELGNTVFSAGKPDEFRKNHETTQAFIRSLEFLAPSLQSVEAMRAHPVYTAFERRWQLPVYFQLRWKEIVTRLEEPLAVTKVERTATKALEPFVTPQAAAVWEAISACWSANVYIPDLGHRFWKLTLQLISRYRTWLQSSLPAVDSLPKGGALPPEKLASLIASPNIGRSSTPTNVPAEVATPESIAADDALLVVCATALTDIKAMESRVWKLWREELRMMLPDTSTAEEEEQIDLEDVLRRALAGLLSFVPPLSSQVILILSRRGCDALLPMRSIPSQFRAMSASRRLPTEASHFVALIFRSLKAFFAVGTADGPGAALKNDYLKAFSEEVFEVVAQRYIYFLSAMKKTEESLRRLKKGKKSAFSLFGTSSSSRDDDGRADEEKIRRQMVLDVEAFAKDARTLGVDVDSSETYHALQELANANLTDE